MVAYPASQTNAQDVYAGQQPDGSGCDE